ncbi:MAG TPA: YfiR family protein [Planctomycetota bacterium]|nr:YfiR family protein [Planctomycetota bacterium]
MSRGGGLRLVRRVLWTVFLAGAIVDAAPAPQEPVKKMPEYELKAGFLYNFGKYVEWPADAFEKPESPITIGILGADPFGPALEKTLKDREAQDRKFSVSRFRDLGDVRRCHILFVPKSEKGRLPEILRAIEGWPTLTVGESENFAASGGAVNILIEKDRPRLEINPDVAEKAKLTIQAKLLKLATIVKTEK